MGFGASLNFYEYASGNPTTNYDPLGLDPGQALEATQRTRFRVTVLS